MPCEDILQWKNFRHHFVTDHNGIILGNRNVSDTKMDDITDCINFRREFHHDLYLKDHAG